MIENATAEQNDGQSNNIVLEGIDAVRAHGRQYGYEIGEVFLKAVSDPAVDITAWFEEVTKMILARARDCVSKGTSEESAKIWLDAVLEGQNLYVESWRVTQPIIKESVRGWIETSRPILERSILDSYFLQNFKA